ncbi:PREDICTED: secreted protein C10orf99 homolog [Miniopterus natalensis]|uniref:secreted protein C10orf99 homolog n=1 Tax=Miniopterus natalensis TaxID=291302 RepID=UPI0007A6F01E|nr:PREDICTED: secreted protein C10orf99 homolog [Miniopterus natalensis]XP_016072946.1 PREDICTED: secreted protein C10orf99 homolog [Miniopterus natalensis]
MRFLVLSSLLCVLLLCFCIFSTEGGRHPGHPARPWKGKRCCSQAPDPVLKTRKGHRVKICRPCKFKPESPFWVVPGALPQV